MFILTDFLDQIFIVLVLSGGLILILKKDIEVIFTKKDIKKLGWNKVILIWLILGVAMQGIWYVITWLF